MNGINRRGFIGLGMGAAAFAQMPLFAAARLDAKMAAADSPVLKKVRFTKLEIKVGAAKPFRAIHCSDSHMAFMSVNDLIGGVDNDLEMYDYRLKEMANGVPSLAACVLRARRENLPLLHTGDLYDYETDMTHFLAKDAFDGLGSYLYAPGNHEYHGHWGPNIAGAAVAASRKRLEADVKRPVSVSSLVVNGVNFVGFDNGGLSFGLEKQQLAAIKKEFAKGLPVVLLCHLPLFTQEFHDDILLAKGKFADAKPLQKETMPWILCGLHAAEKPLVEYLRRQPLLKAVLCGHLHRELQYAFTDTVTQYVAGATYKGNAYEIAFS